MYSFDLIYLQAWSRPYIRSFDLIYVQVDLIYLTLDLIYQILTIYLKTDFCPIWRVIQMLTTFRPSYKKVSGLCQSGILSSVPPKNSRQFTFLHVYLQATK